MVGVDYVAASASSFQELDFLLGKGELVWWGFLQIAIPDRDISERNPSLYRKFNVEYKIELIAPLTNAKNISFKDMDINSVRCMRI